MSIFDIPNEIIALICEDNCALWTMLAIFNDNFREYTLLNRKTFIKQFTTVSEEYDNTTYMIFDRFHREDDLPAVTQYSNEDIQQEWWINGMRHRENDQPAICSSSYCERRYRGMRYRDDQ